MIKGLNELLEKYGKESMTTEQFENELNKFLPETHIPKSVYNELNEKYKMLDKQKKDVDGLLEEANKGLKDSQEFKSKYDSLVAQQKEDLQHYEQAIASMKKGYAIDSALSKAGARNIKAVKALLDESKITLDDSGNVIGVVEQLDTIRKDNDFLFMGSETFKPSFGEGGKSNPPSDTFAKSIAEAMGV